LISRIRPAPPRRASSSRARFTRPAADALVLPVPCDIGQGIRRALATVVQSHDSASGVARHGGVERRIA
jgi:hypothetical protein